MKILYFDCSMGAAGDMLAAALTELLPNPDSFIAEMNSLNIPGVRISKQTSVKCGIKGTHISVTVNGVEEESLDHNHKHEHDHEHEHNHEHNHEYEHEHNHEYEHEHNHEYEHEHNHEHSHEHDHVHNGMHEIEHIVMGHLQLPEQVKQDVMAVYKLIAEAESLAHGVPVSEIHFHEVGAMDAIADITAVCMLIHKLSPDEIVVSPIHVGSGQVRCAHGILPVPAPATAYILKDAPIYGGEIRGELCTPTGAAILKHFATRFGNMPVMKTKAIGYGMGKKDFEAANCVRALLGESEGKTGIVYELSCNVDDMTAEEIGFATERLLENGALDAYTIQIGMKKSRPGIMIRVICSEQAREKMTELIFKYTTTIGIREAQMQRYLLDRTTTTLDTSCGTVRRKDSNGYGVSRSKYEYEDLSRIAREKGISIDAVISLIEGER